MKKIYLLIILMASAFYAGAQYKGEVEVSCNYLEERNGQLYMDLDIHVHARAMNTTQSWTIIPELTTGSANSKKFPTILINGNNKRQMYERRERFESRTWMANRPYIMVNIQRNTDTTFRYIMTVPYEQWMDNAELIINQVLTSCNDQKQLFTVDLQKAVIPEARELYTIIPAYGFVVPQKEEIKRRNVSASAYLDFEVGKSVILPDFRRNPQELQKIRTTLDDIRSNMDVNITDMTITGYTSPEGSYELNTHLSRERAEALRKYIADNYNITRATVNNVPEDWDGLKAMVEKSSSLPSKEGVMNIINSSDDFDVKERRLRELAGGEPYRIMLRDMFPDLRRVEYRVDFDVRDYDVDESKSIFEKNPNLLSNYELYMLANSYERGSAEYNRVYDLMLQKFPDDPATLVNAGAVLIQRGDYTGAWIRLEQAGNNAEALNNLGVLYLQQNDLERAEDYLRRAEAMGSTNARTNLAELQKKREDNIKQERYR